MDSYTRIGQIINAHGIKGDLKVFSHSEYIEYYSKALKQCFIAENNDSFERHDVEKLRPISNGQAYILKLTNVVDRNHALSLAKKNIYVLDTDLAPIGEDEYYVHRLIGLSVVDEHGNEYGVIDGYFENGAHGILEMRTSIDTVLLPYTDEVIIDVNVDQNKIIINPIPGMMELNRS